MDFAVNGTVSPQPPLNIVRMNDHNHAMKALVRRVLLLSSVLALAACQTAAPLPAPALNADQRWPPLRAAFADGAGPLYVVDPIASNVHIYVYRDGAAARYGHNHILSVPRFEGYVQLLSEKVRDARFELRVPLAELVIDDPALRAATGGSFAGERSAGDIEGTRANMLGPKLLDAEKFPQMRLRSLKLEGDWPLPVADVEITLRGVTRTQPVLLRVERGEDKLTVRGEFVLRQTDYGITPFSALGGLMRVADPLAVEFMLIARHRP